MAGQEDVLIKSRDRFVSVEVEVSDFGMCSDKHPLMFQ